MRKDSRPLLFLTQRGETLEPESTSRAYALSLNLSLNLSRRRSSESGTTSGLSLLPGTEKGSGVFS